MVDTGKTVVFSLSIQPPAEVSGSSSKGSPDNLFPDSLTLNYGLWVHIIF